MSGLISSLRKMVHKADTLHRLWLGCPPRLVEAELAGRRLLVREGTVRPSPDYDDAWLFCAGMRGVTVAVQGRHQYGLERTVPVVLVLVAE